MFSAKIRFEVLASVFTCTQDAKRMKRKWPTDPKSGATYGWSPQSFPHVHSQQIELTHRKISILTCIRMLPPFGNVLAFLLPIPIVDSFKSKYFYIINGALKYLFFRLSRNVAKKSPTLSILYSDYSNDPPYSSDLTVWN